VFSRCRGRRKDVALASGFNEMTVNQLAETVHVRVEDFLKAVGARSQILAVGPAIGQGEGAREA
jgi:hypothetical protein